MAAFTIGMCVVPYYAGKVVMAGTNMRAEEGTSLEQQLRARQTLEHKVGPNFCPFGSGHVLRPHTSFWQGSVLCGCMLWGANWPAAFGTVEICALPALLEQ